MGTDKRTLGRALGAMLATENNEKIISTLKNEIETLKKENAYLKDFILEIELVIKKAKEKGFDKEL
jgi:hypothetical protein